ncbi:MAG: hypothetical protein C0408_09565, partial [Odoribacter sp.]|nr:hypothetical protein [Odoribacter sp.]
YNPLYGNVRSTVTLAEGRNTFIITGTNEAGSNRDDVVIIYNKPVTVVLPQLKFINPASPVTVEKNILAISVQTKNVKVWQDVTVVVNGIDFSNFSFSPEGVVQTNIPLKAGINKVQVTGRNESGSASDFATITYTEPSKVIPPSINILFPGTSPFKTFEQVQEIKARITGISGKEKILFSFNGINIPGFTYDVNSLVLSASVTLREGSNTIIITARNDAGQDVKSQNINKETRPCPPPVLRMIEPAQNELTTDNPSFTIRTETRNIVSREGLSIILNNRPVTEYSFSSNEITYVASLVPGLNTYVISAANNCGTEKITYSFFYKPAEVIIEKPCPKPALTFSITPVTRPDANHELKGTVTNVKNMSDITLTVNDNTFEGFSFIPNTGEISSVFNFNPGSYTIKVAVMNECGQDTYSKTVVIEEKPCGIRINPGNSAWEFCLITPSGTISRDTLKSNNFTYSGPAGSLFFKPIAGGGDAIVNGKPYTLRPGQYYLFTGNLTVTVSNKNPGSMGQWSVCIISDREPLTGNGNNRPKSPCEEQ